ncbi:MAG: DUF2812 domain-containing protein [Bacteroidetes bacterium]|nr:DUF2812 domain-containing protein [Bacteroidota bacterium]
MMHSAKSIKRWKLFWAWQDDKEAAWLREMSKEGWHLTHAAPFLYTFQKGEKQDYLYGIDYTINYKKDIPHYLELFTDAGWELAAQMSNYYYFRIAAEDESDMGIFSDNTSRIRKYRTTLVVLAAVSLPLWLFFITGRYEEMVSHSGIVGIIYKTASIIIIPLAIIYIIAFIKLIKKISDHKHDISE